jgi:exodeoxyribonuclease-3
MTRVATWNVNSIKARLAHLLDYLNSAKPDIVLLQEIKCMDDDFPRLEIEAAGYHALSHGQKTYNGVAILARAAITDPLVGLPGDKGDTQARYLEASVGDARVAAIYLPNGNPAPGEKFTYKLAWMERLRRHARRLLDSEGAVIMGGDYNVTPSDDDVYDPEGWKNDALCRPDSRAAFRRIVHQGWTDAFHALHPEPRQYSYWDYMQARFERDQGLRIDHLLLSPRAADRLVASGIDRAPRARDKASDHTPVWCELAQG